MKKPTVPYSLQVAASMISGNKQHQNDVIGNVIATIASDVSEFIQSYDMTDMPFVIAAMQIVSNGLMPILGENGQGIVNKLVSHTQTITMDAETFRKLTEQEGGK